MKLTSQAFKHNQPMPRHYTCQGDNVSPPLEISDVPEEAASLALICDDPDAATDPDGPGHTYDHWVLWNIPPKMTAIAENASLQSADIGQNSSGENKYTGPCPPNGTHRYFFRLYALSTELELPDSAGAEELEDALAGHVLARSELIGTYQKA